MSPLSGLTPTCLSELNWTSAKLNELIKGKRGITAGTVSDLAEILRTTVKLWMNLQATFDLEEAKKRREAVLSCVRKFKL